MSDRLIEVFAREAAEIIGNLANELLLLEDRVANSEDIRQARSRMFISLHGLKGSAMCVAGLESLGEALHHLEEHFQQVAPSAVFPEELTSLALETLDVVRNAVEAAVVGEPWSIPDDLQARLKGEAPPAPEIVPLAVGPAAAITPAADASGEHVSIPERAPPVEQPPNPSRPPELSAPSRDRKPPALSALSKISTPPAAVDDESTAPGSESVARRGKLVRVGASDVDRLLRSLRGLSTFERDLEKRCLSLSSILAGMDAELRQARQALPLRAARKLRTQLEDLEAGLEKDHRRILRIRGEVTDQAGRLSHVRFGTLYEALRRGLRELRRRTGKATELALHGEDIRIDRGILNALRPALLHLLRNAFDHGIEEPETRTWAEKPAHGTITIRAQQEGDRVIVTVADDGAGIDVNAIRSRARVLEIPEADGSLLQILSAPGFSTAAQATEISGRGVGVSSVAELVAELGGQLSLETEPGRGSSFRISLPRSAASERGLIVEVAGHPFCLPTSVVHRVLRRDRVELTNIDGASAIMLEGKAIPRLSLLSCLRLPPRFTQTQAGNRLVIISVARRPVALEVDRVPAQIEIIMEPLGFPLKHLKGIRGLAILSDEKAVPVLEIEELDWGSGSQPDSEVKTPRQARVLVVDDSITTRTLERSLLEGAGMAVTVACDGLEALEILALDSDFDLVVSDVEMPRMNGLELVREIRKEFLIDALPVVLVTSLRDEETRLAGLEAGANDLVVKGSFDPEGFFSVILPLLPARALGDLA